MVWFEQRRQELTETQIQMDQLQESGRRSRPVPPVHYPEQSWAFFMEEGRESESPGVSEMCEERFILEWLIEK